MKELELGELLELLICLTHVHWSLTHGEEYSLKVTTFKRCFPLFFPHKTILTRLWDPVFWVFTCLALIVLWAWENADNANLANWAAIRHIKLKLVWVAATWYLRGNCWYRINILSLFPSEISITLMNLYHFSKRQILEIQVIERTSEEPCV